MTDVSIIIVNYNAGTLLTDGIMLLAGTSAQVIVVDNASSDGSLAHLQSATGSCALPLTLISNPDNRGFAAACNQGIKVATGRQLLFLNPDCRLTPEALGRLSATLDHWPHAGMVGGLLLNADGSEQRGGRRQAPDPGRTLLRLLGLSRWSAQAPASLQDFNLDQTPLPDTAIEVDAISGACMLVSRAAIERVGPWDEGYFLHCEDLDWCQRFRDAGFAVVFEPRAAVPHAQGSCSRRTPIRVEWHKHRGMLRYFRKHLASRFPLLPTPLAALAVYARFAVVAARFAAKTGKNAS